MGKRILAVLLIALFAFGAMTACKKGETGGKTTTASSSDASSQTAGENGGTTANEDAGKSEKGSDKGSENGSDAAAEDSSKKDDTSGENNSDKQDTKKTDGWSRQEDGTLEKGDVQVNVVNYGTSSVSDGEELIGQLVEGGMTGAKVLSKDKDSNKVVYTVRGTRTGADHEEFVKFFYTVDLEKGYLVTVIAQKESGLSTDISYILEHLKELAI